MQGLIKFFHWIRCMPWWHWQIQLYRLIHAYRPSSTESYIYTLELYRHVNKGITFPRYVTNKLYTPQSVMTLITHAPAEASFEVLRLTQTLLPHPWVVTALFKYAHKYANSSVYRYAIELCHEHPALWSYDAQHSVIPTLTLQFLNHDSVEHVPGFVRLLEDLDVLTAILGQDPLLKERIQWRNGPWILEYLLFDIHYGAGIFMKIARLIGFEMDINHYFLHQDRFCFTEKYDDVIYSMYRDQLHLQCYLAWAGFRPSSEKGPLVTSIYMYRYALYQKEIPKVTLDKPWATPNLS